MMKFLRSQSQTVLVLVLAFIAIGFLFYGNAGNLITAGSSHATNDYGRIDGEDLTVADLYDAVREERNTIRLSGGSAQLQQPGSAAQVAESAWAQLLLQHEADRLHIDVTPQEIADFIRKQTVFQKNGAFDLDTYNAQIKQWQVLLHVTPDAGVDPISATKSLFEGIVRDSLRSQAVREALLSSARSSAHDVSEQYGKLFSPTTVSYVTFDPKSYVAQQKVSPADIETEYKSNPTNPAYRTQEKRKVDYVLFMLTPDQQKLPDDQKAAAKNALGEKALNFILAFQPDPSADASTPPPAIDFMTEAQKEKLAPATTDFFTADQAPAGVPPSPAFNQAAFDLSKDKTISRVVDMANGVAVLHLAEIQPSELRPLAEVQGDIEKELVQKQAVDAVRSAAQFTAKLLQASVAKGTSFEQAAANFHLKLVTPPAFVPDAVKSDPQLGIFAYQSVQLKKGQVSDPFALPSGDIYAVLCVLDRTAPDPAGLANFDKEFRAQEDQQLREVVLNDWVSWKSKQPGTRKPAELDAYGTVE